MNDYTSFFRNLAKSLLATLLCCCAMHSCAQTTYRTHLKTENGFLDATILVDPVNDIATIHDWNFSTTGTYPVLAGSTGFILDNPDFPIVFEHVSGYVYEITYIVLGDVYSDVIKFEIVE